MESGQAFTATTNGIKVIAIPLFVPEQSIIHQNMFFWAYNIQIENMRPEVVQLMGRHWQVVDANGDVQDVQGVGVVGQQPIIQPGGRFQYSSGTFLKTPSGMMLGQYIMQISNNEEKFEVEIPAFSLDSPYETHKPA